MEDRSIHSPLINCLTLSMILAYLMSLTNTTMAQPAPVFVSIQNSNQEMRLRLTATKGLNYQIDTTTNLLEWLPLVILTNSTGAFEHLDTGAPMLNSRFYRAKQLVGTNILTGDYLITDSGEVVIHPIHHATMVITWQNKTLYIDPVGGTTPFQGLPRGDLILVTHEHTDHFDVNTINAVKGTNAVIFTTRTVSQSLSTSLKAITGVLTNGAMTNILGIDIKAIPAYNLTSQNHPKGVGNGYILNLGGKNVYISGDTDDTPEMRALQGIDVAFVCMDGTYNMGVTPAANAVRQFRPAVVYAYHYLTSNINTFKQLVGIGQGIEVRLRTWE